MRVDAAQELAVARPPWPSELQEAAGSVAGDSPARFSSIDLESLALNLDASLNVRARHQFFSWTQGALQSLLGHELLMCALRDDRSAWLCVDSFSTAPVEPAHFNGLFRQDVSLVPHIIKSWEDNHCQSVVCELESVAQSSPGAMTRELTRLGATHVLAHGTHDAAGQLTSFFTFACRPGAIGPRQAYFAEMVVPFLHAAWVRTQVNWLARSAGAKHAEAGLVTSREREVLEWMYRGKSNIEIGMILKISPLTVKNHVQKILRRLNVLNRTQAVGKALALRVLNP